MANCKNLLSCCTHPLALVEVHYGDRPRRTYRIDIATICANDQMSSSEFRQGLGSSVGQKIVVVT